MSDFTLPLPLTVAVAENGAVLVESGPHVIAMSRFSERAKRLTLDFGPGTHILRTAQDVEDVPAHTLDDLVGAVES